MHITSVSMLCSVINFVALFYVTVSNCLEIIRFYSAVELMVNTEYEGTRKELPSSWRNSGICLEIMGKRKRLSVMIASVLVQIKTGHLENKSLSRRR
jgi:hypothetical protein